MSVQTVWLCLVQRSELSKHLELFELMLYSTVTITQEKMKMDDLTMKNIPRSKVTHIGSRAASDSLKKHNPLC